MSQATAKPATPTPPFVPVLLLLEEQGALRAVSATGEVRLFADHAALNAACKPGKVVVSPRLNDCLSAQVSTAGLPKSSAARYSALLYRLEERLPLDAERMAAAFMVSHDHALGLAVEHDRLLPQLTELEAADWFIEAVVPWPLLVGAPSTSSASKKPATPADPATAAEPALGVPSLFLLQDGSTLAWLEHSQGKITRWLHQPDVAAETQHWQAQHGQPPKPIQDDQPLVAAAQGAVQALKSPWDIPFNLRVGPLAKGDTLERLQLPIGLAWLAACLLAITVLAVAWQRTRTYEAQVTKIREADRRLYQEVYPGEIPQSMAVGSRLDALARSLPAAGAADTSVLPSVVSLFKGLSAAPPLQMDEIQLRPNQLFLSGQAQSATDCAKVADALRGPFLMDTPRIERRNNEQNNSGVQFTLTGKPQKGGVK